MDDCLSQKVFNNPYILTEVLKRVDVRSLANCHLISKSFLDAAVYEHEKRKDIIHLYLLNHSNESYRYLRRDVPNLFDSFCQFTRLWLDMRPKNVIVMVGGYRQNHIDYRSKILEQLTALLPKNCESIYLDVGHTILTSSIRHKSLTNYYEERRESQQTNFQRTAFPCMSCLLIPQIDGVHIKTYHTIESVDIKDVKCILLFTSSKKLNQKTIFEKHEEIRRTRREISLLLAKLEYNVSFGGGAIVAAISKDKSYFKEYLLREHLILTFGGDGVRTASAIISTEDSEQFLPQLENFKNGLDFDCENWKNGITIGYVFANYSNFSQRFTSAFQTVFPFVGIFGFQSNKRMFGKHFSTDHNSGLNRLYENINPSRNSVIVLVNIEKKNF